MICVVEPNDYLLKCLNPPYLKLLNLAYSSKQTLKRDHKNEYESIFKQKQNTTCQEFLHAV